MKIIDIFEAYEEDFQELCDALEAAGRCWTRTVFERVDDRRILRAVVYERSEQIKWPLQQADELLVSPICQGFRLTRLTASVSCKRCGLSAESSLSV